MNNKGADQTAWDAQTGLRLYCSQPPEDRFSRVERQEEKRLSVKRSYKLEKNMIRLLLRKLALFLYNQVEYL